MSKKKVPIRIMYTILTWKKSVMVGTLSITGTIINIKISNIVYGHMDISGLIHVQCTRI